MASWHAPLDPDCPKVAQYMAELDTGPSDCADEISKSFEQRHRAKCVRCQDYGAENISVG